MFKAMLMTQWKWGRIPAALGALLAFAVPIMSLQRATVFFGPGEIMGDRGREVLEGVIAWAAVYPVLAMSYALTIAAVSLAQDQRGRHVYALSLPIPRWHYALLRLGAGGVLLVAPIVALALGALIATQFATIPAGMSAQPWALTIRFGLALLVAYAVFFAIASASPRTGRYAAGALAGLVVLHLLLAATLRVDVLRLVGEWLVYYPGPLQIFTGRWMLIDV